MIRRRFSKSGSDIIFISNLDEVLKDLKKIDPEARKAFNTDTRLILKPYVEMARGFVPMESPLSGWRTVEPTYTSATGNREWQWQYDSENRGRDARIRWKWDPGDAKRNIKITRGYDKSRADSTYDNIIGLKNDSVSGKMYELIGQGKVRRDNRRVGRNKNAHVVMRSKMNAIHGNRKRVVWRIKEEHGAAIAGKMQNILDPILARFGRGS